MKFSNLTLILIIFINFFLTGVYIYQKEYIILQQPTHPVLTSKTKPLKEKSRQISKLSIEQIFSKDIKSKQNPDFKIIATGDVIPARSVNSISNNKNDFTWAWKNIFQKLQTADLTVINLETPLLKKCQPTIEGMVFCGKNQHLQGLKLAGVDIVNLANNHSGNYGATGIEETINLLKAEQITISGTNNQRIVYKTVKNTKLAFLGYNSIGAREPLINWLDLKQIKHDIKQAKQNADLVIVQFHWGIEYVSQPQQQSIGISHQAIDWGADLILGNHPHWIQPVEIYHNKIITYAHGNLIFDQEWSRETKLGVIGEYLIKDKKFINVNFYPVKIINYGQPYFLEGDKAQKILDKMYQNSKILRNHLLNR